ncbi:MAG: hypothetical protein SGJ19_11750 [Planctomycetia bacterium]|nr:hypothetical protein [Planctomycetia bacterium]
MSEVAVLRFALLLGCVAGLSGLSGCGGGSPYDTVPISGTVTLADGGDLKGYAMKTIRLAPNSTDAEARPASGEVQEDGTFKLGTKTASDGAIPGKYAVFASIMKNYPPTPADISKTWVCDPAEIDVKEGMEPISIKVSVGK